MRRANAHVVHSVEVFCFRLSLRVGASGAYRAAQRSGRMLMTAAFTYRAKELTRVCVCVGVCLVRPFTKRVGFLEQFCELHLGIL